MNLQGFQTHVGQWVRHNFGPQSDLVLYGGTAEEAGELLRCAVKREQGIRGSRSEWDQRAREEIGDVVIKLASICEAEGWDLTECIRERWADVSMRDWRADPIGHGMPTEEDVKAAEAAGFVQISGRSVVIKDAYLMMGVAE